MNTFTRSMSRSSAFDLITSPIEAEYEDFMSGDTSCPSHFIHSTTPLSQNDIEFSGDTSVASRSSSCAEQDRVIDCVIERLHEYVDQMSRSAEILPTCLSRSGKGVKNLRKLEERARQRHAQSAKTAQADERLGNRRNGIDLARY